MSMWNKITGAVGKSIDSAVNSMTKTERVVGLTGVGVFTGGVVTHTVGTLVVSQAAFSSAAATAGAALGTSAAITPGVIAAGQAAVFTGVVATTAKVAMIAGAGAAIGAFGMGFYRGFKKGMDSVDRWSSNGNG